MGGSVQTNKSYALLLPTALLVRLRRPGVLLRWQRNRPRQRLLPRQLVATPAAGNPPAAAATTLLLLLIPLLLLALLLTGLPLLWGSGRARARLLAVHLRRVAAVTGGVAVAAHHHLRERSWVGHEAAVSGHHVTRCRHVATHPVTRRAGRVLNRPPSHPGAAGEGGAERAERLPAGGGLHHAAAAGGAGAVALGAGALWGGALNLDALPGDLVHLAGAEHLLDGGVVIERDEAVWWRGWGWYRWSWDEGWDIGAGPAATFERRKIPPPWSAPTHLPAQNHSPKASAAVAVVIHHDLRLQDLAIALKVRLELVWGHVGRQAADKDFFAAGALLAVLRDTRLAIDLHGWLRVDRRWSQRSTRVRHPSSMQRDGGQTPTMTALPRRDRPHHRHSPFGRPACAYRSRRSGRPLQCRTWWIRTLWACLWLCHASQSARDRGVRPRGGQSSGKNSNPRPFFEPQVTYHLCDHSILAKVLPELVCGGGEGRFKVRLTDTLLVDTPLHPPLWPRPALGAHLQWFPTKDHPETPCLCCRPLSRAPPPGEGTTEALLHSLLLPLPQEKQLLRAEENPCTSNCSSRLVKQLRSCWGAPQQRRGWGGARSTNSFVLLLAALHGCRMSGWVYLSCPDLALREAKPRSTLCCSLAALDQLLWRKIKVFGWCVGNWYVKCLICIWMQFKRRPAIQPTVQKVKLTRRKALSPSNQTSWPSGELERDDARCIIWRQLTTA